MKRLFLFVLLFALIGCTKPAPQKNAVVTINNYSISPDEFEAEFRDSAFGRKDTLDSRRQFMEVLINRKLMLQEAQRQGIDREKDFLKSIERFWEQSLLKAYLDRKSQEVAGKVMITDFAVEQTYKNLQAEGKAEKPYEEMYKELKWQLTRAKEAQVMDEWIKELRSKADIKENPGLLKAK